MSVFAEFRLPRSAYPLGEALARHEGVDAEVERLVPLGRATHHVWLTGTGRRDVAATLRSDGVAGAVETVDELPEWTLLRVDWDGYDSPVFELVEGADGTVLDLRGTHRGWTTQVRFPDQTTLTTFYEGCREQGVEIELRGFDGIDALADEGFGLTATQAETLTTAFETGYFDVPRRITLAELADRLDVSEQAVSERLRRGLASLLTAAAFGETAE